MDNQESGLNKAISLFSKSIAAVAALLITPDVFNSTREPIYKQLRKMWSPDVADILTWVIGFITGLSLYAAISLGLTTLIVVALGAFSARQFDRS